MPVMESIFFSGTHLMASLINYNLILLFLILCHYSICLPFDDSLHSSPMVQRQHATIARFSPFSLMKSLFAGRTFFSSSQHQDSYHPFSPVLWSISKISLIESKWPLTDKFQLFSYSNGKVNTPFPPPTKGY